MNKSEDMQRIKNESGAQKHQSALIDPTAIKLVWEISIKSPAHNTISLG